MATTTCGVSSVISGNPMPLVCNLDAGHDGRHGIRQYETAAPYVTWGDGKHVVIPQAEFLSRERLAWKKGHVRRPYQTLKMWKAGRT